MLRLLTCCLSVFSHLGDFTGEVMCGMGMSAAITQSEVIVGSPGSFEWQGDSILFYSDVFLPLHPNSERASQLCERLMQFMVCVVGNVHVSWMNPDDEFDTKKSSFSNQKHRNIYIGAPSL